MLRRLTSLSPRSRTKQNWHPIYLPFQYYAFKFIKKDLQRTYETRRDGVNSNHNTAILFGVVYFFVGVSAQSYLFSCQCDMLTYSFFRRTTFGSGSSTRRRVFEPGSESRQVSLSFELVLVGAASMLTLRTFYPFLDEAGSSRGSCRVSCAIEGRGRGRGRGGEVSRVDQSLFGVFPKLNPPSSSSIAKSHRLGSFQIYVVDRFLFARLSHRRFYSPRQCDSILFPLFFSFVP